MLYLRLATAASALGLLRGLWDNPPLGTVCGVLLLALLGLQETLSARPRPASPRPASPTRPASRAHEWN